MMICLRTPLEWATSPTSLLVQTSVCGGSEQPVKAERVADGHEYVWSSTGEAHAPVHIDLRERRHLVRAPRVEQLGRAAAATIIAGVLDKELGGRAHSPFYIE